MNKYLEKIAVVSKLVKAQRRVKQLLQSGTHDFKSMSADSAISALHAKKLNAGTWGTNGAGVYAGHRAPAHGYQPSGHSDRIIAFLGTSEHAVPHEANFRFHHQKMPVQDSVVPHDVHLDKGSYVTLPSGAKNLKKASPGEKHLVSDMEEGIRKSRSRRIYDDDLRNELHRRGLFHKGGWDLYTEGAKKPVHTGNDYLDVIKEKLRGNTVSIPRKDMRHALRKATGEAGSIRDVLLEDLKHNRKGFNRRDLREQLDDAAHSHLAESGEYRKYLKG